MSDKTAKPTVHTVTSLEEKETPVEKAPKFARVRKVVTAAKSNPKTTLAVIGLGALVGVSAFAGRKSAQATLSIQSPLLIEDAGVVEGEVVEDDTVTA